MSLVPDYADSSEDLTSDSDSETPRELCVPQAILKFTFTKNRSAVINFSPIEDVETVMPTSLDKLPTPGFLSNQISKNLPTTSVFTNPFIEAEIAKKAILEKHVKMVNTKDNTALINGKKICWNYRKGRCRFGHNCKFAHDSDLQKTKEQLEIENQMQQTVICQSQDLPQPSIYEINQIKEESITNNQKRKRPGLTQGLVPGKKVMKNYMNQRK